MKKNHTLSGKNLRGPVSDVLWTPARGRPQLEQRRIVLPPFAKWEHKFKRAADLFRFMEGDPNQFDVILDSSVFSPARIALAAQLLFQFRPKLLLPVLVELTDLLQQPHLAEVSKLIFRGDQLTPSLSAIHLLHGEYQTTAARYVNLLRWRKQMVNVALRVRERETGTLPTGKARAQLIRELGKGALGSRTITLGGKKHNEERPADEFLAVHGVLNPIVTGRDCYILTADIDVFEQTDQLCSMVFEAYGAYLLAQDFRNNPSRYPHRHEATSGFMEPGSFAIGRDAEPDYLLPPNELTDTVATHVFDVTRFEGFTRIFARNMEPSLAFQDQDPMGRKGDPADGLSIHFGIHQPDCPKESHFVVGRPRYLKVIGSSPIAPIEAYDLFTSATDHRELQRTKKRRVLAPDQARREQMLDAIDGITIEL